MSPITSHVLDTARGCPAAGLSLRLDKKNGDAWDLVAEGITNEDGRAPGLMKPGELQQATYRMTFFTGAYLESLEIEGFYPKVEVEFVITRVEQHYHIPLLLSPFGYSTYRGS